jgi:hypothetical protein
MEESRSGVPMSTRWTFTPALLASVHCTSAALRPPGFACFRSSLVGIGTPSLIDCVMPAEAGSGSDRTDSTCDAASPPPNPTATQRWGKALRCLVIVPLRRFLSLAGPQLLLPSGHRCLE